MQKRIGSFTQETLFVGSPAQTKTVVEFKIPDGWNVITPWKSPSRNTFEVPSFAELTNVALVMGKYSERSLKVGQTEVAIALGQDLANSMDLFEAMLKPLLASTADFFAGSPPGKFAILANRDTYTSGGAFTRSVSMVFEAPPTDHAKPFIAHILCHEMIHLWIGNAIRAADEARENWLTEGFTDHLSYQIILVAVALDAEINKASSGTNNFQTMMRKMYQQYGVTARPYTIEDVVQLASREAGEDLSPFFNSYVKERGPFASLTSFTSSHERRQRVRATFAPNGEPKLVNATATLEGVLSGFLAHL